MTHSFRTALALILVVGLAVSVGLAQKPAPASADVQLKAAVTKEVVDGDLKAAIEMYRALTKGPDRVVAAKALVRMGQCYEKLGNAESRKAYEEVLRAFADQPEAVAEARARLAALAAGRPAGDAALSIRQVWADAEDSGRVSFDGRYLSFADWDFDGNLAIRDLATGQSRRLTTTPGFSRSSDFTMGSAVSPDGRLVAYAWYTTNEGIDIRVIGTDGSKPRIVRPRERNTASWPLVWSRDSRLLAFVAYKDDPADRALPATYSLAVLSVADGATQPVESTGTFQVEAADFSPDGRYLAYSPGRGKLSLFDVSSGRVLPLFQDRSSHTVLGWAADGRHLVFSSDRQGTKDAWVLPVADGKVAGEPVVVKRDFAGWPMGLTRTGAFYFSTTTTAAAVRVTDMKAGGPADRLTVGGTARHLTGSSRDADWSPDGQFLAYRVDRDSDQFIVIQPASGGSEREFPLGKTKIAMTLLWAPDGKTVLFPGFDEGRGWRLMSLDPQTGAVREQAPLALGAYSMLPVLARVPAGFGGFFPGLKSGYNTTRDPADINYGLLVSTDFTTGVESPVPITRQFNLAHVVLSPDGRAFAAIAYDGRTQLVLVVPASGGAARVVARVDGDEETNWGPPAWTADSQFVIYAKGLRGKAWKQMALWRVSAAGGTPERIGPTIDNLRWVRPHPDGRRLALGSSTSRVDIWAMENFLPKAAAAPARR